LQRSQCGAALRREVRVASARDGESDLCPRAKARVDLLKLLPAHGPLSRTSRPLRCSALYTDSLSLSLFLLADRPLVLDKASRKRCSSTRSSHTRSPQRFSRCSILAALLGRSVRALVGRMHLQVLRGAV